MDPESLPLSPIFPSDQSPSTPRAPGNQEKENESLLDNYNESSLEHVFESIDEKDFTMRVCQNFKKERRNGPSSQLYGSCDCGFMYSEHIEEAQQNCLAPEDEWDTTYNTKAIPTNAYGEIEFNGDSGSNAKYVRVSHDTPMKSMVKLLSSSWEMEMPNLLISVTGSAIDVKMCVRLKEAFRRGLKKAALGISGCWIVTDGAKEGVTELVGEALKDYEGKVTTIGIIGWGTLGNKESLIHTDCRNGPAKYHIDNNNDDIMYLEPHHTHYILVDNGTQGKYFVEIPFRAKFEQEMGKQRTKTGENVPVCLIVLGGGPGSLKTVYQALHSGTPTVVVKGSGRTAEILAYAYQNVKFRETEGNERESYFELDVLDRIEELAKKAFDHQGCYLEWIKRCVEKVDLLSVFELDARDSAKDVDVAILKALLKAKASDPGHQLRLAVAWNRMDIARSEIFTDSVEWDPCQYNDILLSAIQLNRVDFVNFFLRMGFRLHISVEMIVSFYKRVGKNCLLYRLLCETKRSNTLSSLTLKDVSRLIETLVENPYQSNCLGFQDDKGGIRVGGESGSGDLEDKDAAHELFLWAVLMNYHELSKVFWSQSKDSAIPRALFAQNILLAMKKRTTDSLLLRELQASIEDYGQVACELINTFYKSNEEMTQKLLKRKMEFYGHTSSLNLALQAENTSFVAQPACLSCFNTEWHGGMKEDTSLLLVILCILFPPLILLFIGFTEEETKRNPKPRLKRHAGSSTKPISRRMKLYMFYKSPIVKFCLNVFSFATFLVLYSYILLVMLSDRFHWPEAILIACVFTSFVEEIRQLFSKPNYTFKSKVKAYISNSWNVLDIINISLFFVGYGLRFKSGLLEAARVFLGINFITFSVRSLHVFSISKQLGPLLSMIHMMVKDLLRFVAILFVFIVSYAVASEAILYPEATLSWETIYNLPRKAYWQIYGELFLEDIEGSSDCTDDSSLYNDGGQLRCPSTVGRYFVPVLLGSYTLMTNVMLLNILIAIFSNIFQRIQDNIDMYWNLQLFYTVSEYIDRPVLPPPLIIISHLWLLLTAIFNRCRRGTNSTGSNGPFCDKIADSDVKELIQWERVTTYNYLEKCENQKDETVAMTTKKRFEDLSMSVNKLQELLETQKQSQDDTLGWIVAALQQLGANGLERSSGRDSFKDIVPNEEGQRSGDTSNTNQSTGDTPEARIKTDVGEKIDPQGEEKHQSPKIDWKNRKSAKRYKSK